MFLVGFFSWEPYMISILLLQLSGTKYDESKQNNLHTGYTHTG